MSPQELRRQILEALSNDGPANARELSDKLGVSIGLVRHQLSVLTCHCGGVPIIAMRPDGRLDIADRVTA
jgi:DNA-binding transcriptional ArsR family regulator